MALALLQRGLLALAGAVVSHSIWTEWRGSGHDAGLEAALGAIEQSFDGQALYRTAQERAAHLLYFVVKDHPFADGNKRIGALLFLEFLRRHGLLLHADGQPRLPDTAVAALTLLIAESRPAQKDLMVRLVVSLLAEHRPEAGTTPAATVGEAKPAYAAPRLTLRAA